MADRLPATLVELFTRSGWRPSRPAPARQGTKRVSFCRQPEAYRGGSRPVKIRVQMLKRLVFWEYSRGSWQYDVIVGAILAFVFFAPRSWFRDQPRVPQVSAISIARGEFMVDPEFWTGTAENLRMTKLTQEVRARAGNPRLTVTSVVPFLDSDGELRFYIAFTRQ